MSTHLNWLANEPGDLSFHGYDVETPARRLYTSRVKNFMIEENPWCSHDGRVYDDVSTSQHKLPQ